MTDNKLIDKNFIQQNDIITFQTLFLEKAGNQWLWDSDSTIFTNFSSSGIDNFMSGTKVIYTGLAWSKKVRKRKHFRAISYKLDKPLEFGDTLDFSFYILADDIGGFQPDLYLSEKIKHKNGFLKNGNYLKFSQKFPTRSDNDHHLVQAYFKIIGNNQNKKSRWLHIVNDIYGDEGGFIVSNCYERLKESDSLNNIVDNSLDHQKNIDLTYKFYFEINSFELTNSTRKELASFYFSILANNNLTIEVSGFADNSGTNERNDILSQKRAESIKLYLEELGLEPHRFVSVVGKGIADFGTHSENRVCIVKTL